MCNAGGHFRFLELVISVMASLVFFFFWVNRGQIQGPGGLSSEQGERGALHDVGEAVDVEKEQDTFAQAANWK